MRTLALAATLSAIFVLPAAAQQTDADCQSNDLLYGIREGMAEQTLDDRVLRLEFSNAHRDSSQMMYKETPYGYVLHCTAQLGGRTIYYGTKGFNGHTIGVWKMPNPLDQRETASRGAIVLD
jgi:hypothetical protein